MMTGLELSVPPTRPLGRREGLEVEPTISGQCFNQLHPCKKPP